MVVVDSDLQIRKSLHQAAGITSLGGNISNEIVSEDVSSLWDEIKSSELSSSVVGEYEVRCVYIFNDTKTNETLELVHIYFEQNTAAPFTDIDLGVGTSAIGDIEQTVTDENTLPSNIGWTFARGEENAQLLGDIAPNQGKAVWLRRHAGPARSDSSYPSDNYVLAFKVKRTGPAPPPPGGGGGSGNDPFGIRMIYPTNTFEDASLPFYIKMSDPLNDCRLSTNMEIGKNADGTLWMGASPRIRMYMSGVSGCQKDVIFTATNDTYDHDEWGARRYMYQDNEWRNVEITGYFKCVDLGPESERKLYLYSRTWRHNTTVGGGCGGSAYKGVIYGATGELKFHKESFHNGSQPCGDRNIEVARNDLPRTDNNQWFGMKMIMWNYNNPTSGKPNVHMEIWLDLQANNTWQRYADRNDNGQWYPGTPDLNCPGDGYCGGNRDQIIIWGGPITEIRWDAGYTKVDFKYLSCREIIPPTTETPPPPAPSPVPPPPPPGPPPDVDAFGTKMIYQSKEGGPSWAATAWSNASNRTITNVPDNCTADPSDSRLKVTRGDQNVNIDGAGKMRVAGNENSPRVVITDTWQNVESTAYILCNVSGTDDINIDMRSKTDHFCVFNAGNFGGYNHNFNFLDDSIYFKKEQQHGITDGYTPRTLSIDRTLDNNIWYGFKSICYTKANGGVHLETWIDETDGVNGGNWVKINQYDDDGNWIHNPDTSSKFAAHTAACGGSGIRFNRGGTSGYYDVKKWTVREIIPTLVGETPPPPPGGGPPPPGSPAGLDPFGVFKLHPTKSGGTEWFSTKWATGGARDIAEGAFDPQDSRLQWSNGDPDTVKLHIDGSGDGEAHHKDNEFCSNSRIRVVDTWLNTEMTIYQYSPSGDTGIGDTQLRSRSRHETACSFGNYIVKFRDTVGYTGSESAQRNCAVEVEAMHTDSGGYVRNLSEVGLPAGLPKNQWIGFKQVTRTETATGKVKVEGYINYDISNQTAGGWTGLTSHTFDGTGPDVPDSFATDSTVDGCLASGDGQGTKMNNKDPQCFRYTQTGNMCWVRSNGAASTKWKFMSVREIDPI